MLGMMCDTGIAARVKGKVYKIIVRQTMMYGLEKVALTKRQDGKPEVGELTMITFSFLKN